MRVMELKGKTGSCKLMTGESISNLRNYCNPEKTVVVTDKNVNRLYGKIFSGFEVVEIGTGEEAKTLETVGMLYQKFLELEIERLSLVIGIGGGVVCDVTGFAASTYLRGVRFGFVPTTLLAQVDASIGGKNGVNLKGYKNLVGVIRQPEFCLIDFDVLKTLPEQEIRCGFAEIIKSAAIADAQLFSYLEGNIEDALLLKRTAIEKVVNDSVAVKAGIVSADENERGERRKLNFGHTIGHSVEKASGGRISHGDAISIGMVIASNISVSMGMLERKDAYRLEKLLRSIKLPTSFAGIDRAAVLDAIKKDKKRSSDVINMALLEGIGKCTIKPVKISELEGVLNDL